MSLIDDLLVSIDDKPGLTKEELISLNDKVNQNAILSGIARLSARGLVKKINLGYELTSSGKDMIESYLDSLDEFKSKSKKWYLILVEIPESKRLKREKLRYELKKIGVGSLKKGAFIAHASSTGKIDELIKTIGVEKQSYILEITSISLNNEGQFAKNGWDWQNLEKMYQDFLDKAKKFLNEASTLTNESRRIEAKKLVMQFSRILAQDPKISSDITIPSKSRGESLDLYSKIQPYCYD